MLKEIERPESTVNEVATPPAYNEIQARRRTRSLAPHPTTKFTRDGEESTPVA